MTPQIPVSWGELIDKITILEIKAARLSSETARANVRRELERLAAVAASAEHSKLAALKSALKHVNETLWQIEDDIRDKEAKKIFDAGFVELARAIYRNNDERGRLKAEINAALGSELVEEKQYVRY